MKSFPEPCSVFTVSRYTISRNWFSQPTNILRISFALPQKGEKREPKSGGKPPERENHLSLFSLALAMETVENRRRFPHRSHSHAHPLFLLRLSPCRREHIYHKKRMSGAFPRTSALVCYSIHFVVSTFLVYASANDLYAIFTPFLHGAAWRYIDLYFQNCC